MKTQSHPLRARTNLRAGDTSAGNYSNTMQTISNVLSMMKDIQKNITANIRA